MTALLYSWFVLTSIFLNDVTAPQTESENSFHVNPRTFKLEALKPIFEPDERASVNAFNKGEFANDLPSCET